MNTPHTDDPHTDECHDISLEMLSKRQQVIMVMLLGAPGLTTERIADLLEVGEDTIEADMAVLKSFDLVERTYDA